MLTDYGFLAPGQPWPPESEIERLALYQEKKLLFEGKHHAAFIDQLNKLSPEHAESFRLVLNWHKRLSTLWADLLLGETPRISGGKEEEQDTVDRYNEDNTLITTAYEVGIDLSRFGTGIFKVRFDGTKAVIDGNPPQYWFPVVNPENLKEVKAHVLAWVNSTVVPGTFKSKKIETLQVEIHEKGKIVRSRYAIANGKITGVEFTETQDTLVDEFLVIPVNNLLTTDRVVGYDDYMTLDNIIMELESRFSQIARILDKHADPNMYGPDSALEYDAESGQYVFRGGGKYFPVAEGEKEPGYVTWDGRLDMAFKEIDMLMDQLYFLSETTAAAFGQLKSGMAESGSALKRLLLTPLAHVNRIRMQFDPAVKKVIKVANQLEIAQGVKDIKPLSKVVIAWQDGLPKDDKEVTDIEVSKYSAGLTSLESSLRRLEGLEGEALQKEVDRIRAQEDAEAERQTKQQLAVAATRATSVTDPKDPTNPQPKVKNQIEGKIGGKE
jgi:Phage portal protein, SPP1 Gp6-like